MTNEKSAEIFWGVFWESFLVFCGFFLPFPFLPASNIGVMAGAAKAIPLR